MKIPKCVNCGLCRGSHIRREQHGLTFTDSYRDAKWGERAAHLPCGNWKSDGTPMPTDLFDDTDLSF